MENNKEENFRLYGWGFSKYGQTGSLEFELTTNPIEIKNGNEQDSINLKSIFHITSGEFHNAIITDSKKIYLFGKNSFGQLGLGHNHPVSIPTQVKIQNKIKHISCGSEHTIALTQTAELFTWGLNIFGQLGLNDKINRNIPTKVDNLRQFVVPKDNNVTEYAFESVTEKIIEIAAGAHHSLILTNGSNIFSCGFSKHKALGYFCYDNDPKESLVFTKIDNLTQNVISISAGVYHSACVIGPNEIMIWGEGPIMKYNKPTIVSLEQNSENKSSELLGIKDLFIGSDYFILLKNSCEVFVGGSNISGQLGFKSITKKEVNKPEKINLPEKIESISCGYDFIFAMSFSQKVYAWGKNSNGELLDSGFNLINTPKELSLLSSSKPNVISCGAYHVIMWSRRPIALSDPQKKNVQTKHFEILKEFDPKEYKKQLSLYEAIESDRKANILLVSEKTSQLENLKISVEEAKKNLTNIISTNNSSPRQSTIDGKSSKHRRKSSNTKPESFNYLFDEDVKMEELIFPKNNDVGVGTFGEVKSGYWRRTLVAIKFLKKSLENEKENISSFVEELNLLKKLRHPNILLFLAANIRGPDYFLITEFCKNGNLFTYLHSATKKGEIPYKEKIRIALEICKGVYYLHSFNPPILHRDLKSLNILLDKNNQVKIADFGWARLLDSHMTKQRGTFQWMAPEVIKKNSYTEKADVYSFAIILWEIFVQEPPYKGVDKIQVATKVAKDAKYRPSLEQNPPIPQKIKELINICWNYNPDGRPDFKQIIEYLDNIKDEEL